MQKHYKARRKSWEKLVTSTRSFFQRSTHLQKLTVITNYNLNCNQNNKYLKTIYGICQDFVTHTFICKFRLNLLNGKIDQRPLAPNLPTWVNSILPKSSCTIALVRNTYLAKVPGYFWHGSEFYLGRFCILLHQTSKVVHAEGFMCARDAAPR